MAQSWNNLISFIKKKVGAPMNYLEFSDDDIRKTIVDDVLPAMSQYIGKPWWTRIGAKDRINTAHNSAYSTPDIIFDMYKIPVPDSVILVDVQHVYWNRDNIGVMGIYQNMLTVMDPRDTVMTNEFLDMLNSLEAVQAFHFVAPDKIYFERPLLNNDVILECKIEHSDLTSIPSDVYHEYLKPWALAEIFENLAAIRKKYRTVNVPFGQIDLNWDDLESKAAQLRQSIQEKLDATPPDHLIHIF